jgi:hypothetical protein
MDQWSETIIFPSEGLSLHVIHVQYDANMEEIAGCVPAVVAQGADRDEHQGLEQHADADHSVGLGIQSSPRHQLIIVRHLT